MKENLKISLPRYSETHYKKNETTWDLETPHPVFEELINSNLLEKKGKVVILGCRKGHNAILFAKAGYDVTAIDSAMSAILETRKLAKKSKVNLTTYNLDFFYMPGRLIQKFDYAIEYAIYCSIEPKRRTEYLDNIRILLKPRGTLIGLFYPIDKHKGNFPFTVDLKKLTSHLKNSYELIHSYIPKSSVSSRLGKEILMLWKKSQFL